MGITYKDAGVDVDGGNSFVQKIAPLVKTTFSERVITGIGGFGALFNGSFSSYKEPVLVSSTDGVGTKLKIAQMMNKHDTIGIDAVAMCVNDIIVSGAQPLFFLDYIACGKLKEDVLVDVVKGLVAGCKMSDCSLIGGETAEHPNVMEPNDYDIAGFTVGVVERSKVIDGSTITPGDVVLGISSSGIHSNGFSLVRKLFFDVLHYSLDKQLDELQTSLGEALLAPTRIYVRPVLDCISSGVEIKGIVHITGGGFIENIPRILPPGTSVIIHKNSYTIPSIFKIMKREGGLDDKEMYTTFNMGIGMMLVLDKQFVNQAMAILQKHGETVQVIGEISVGHREVSIQE